MDKQHYYYEKVVYIADIDQSKQLKTDININSLAVIESDHFNGIPTQ